MLITYGSVCSGIEAATQAWHPLGMRAAWFADIEPFPSAGLAHHYPDVPNHGDMTKLAAFVLAGKIPAPDVLVGGTPCQAFSVAGMREGLTAPRGALTVKYVKLADAVDYVRVIYGKADYFLAHGADGKPFTKTQQVHMCGNSVSPPPMAALARANDPWRAIERQSEAA